jgi:hypothetical protein
MWVSGKAQPLLVFVASAHEQRDRRARRRQTAHGIVPKIRTRQLKPPMKRPTFGIAAGYARFVRAGW